MSKKAQNQKYDEWELKDMVRTLREAEKIKTDKAKMKALMPYLKEEKKAISSLAELIEKRKDLESKGR